MGAQRSGAWGWTLGLGLTLAAVGAPAAQAPTTASAALDRLRAGNASFVTSPEGFVPISIEGRSATTDPPTPLAAVLSCADARVPPEVVFHTGLGELYVVRAVGHVTDRSILASLEYATQQGHVPLVVVMGHESCGAVRAALETPPAASLGANLDYVVGAIRPAATATGSGELRAAILGNVEETINRLLDGSPILREQVESGAVGVVGAYYEMATGRVHFSEFVEFPATPARENE